MFTADWSKENIFLKLIKNISHCDFCECLHTLLQGVMMVLLERFRGPNRAGTALNKPGNQNLWVILWDPDSDGLIWTRPVATYWFWPRRPCPWLGGGWWGPWTPWWDLQEEDRAAVLSQAVLAGTSRTTAVDSRIPETLMLLVKFSVLPRRWNRTVQKYRPWYGISMVWIRRLVPRCSRSSSQNGYG